MWSTVVAGNNRLPSRSEESGSHGQAFDPFTSKYGGKDGGNSAPLESILLFDLFDLLHEEFFG